MTTLQKMLLMLLFIIAVNVSAQVTIERNSSSGSPTLILKETEDDFSRLYFQNTNNGSGQYWSITGKMGTDDDNSHLRIFYNGTSSSGFPLAITGQRRIGIGTLTPQARLTIFQDGSEEDKGLRFTRAGSMNVANIWMDNDDFRIQNGESLLNGFTITSDKRIGAFTDTPNAKFEIYNSDAGYSDPLFQVRTAISVPPFSTNVDAFEVQADRDVYVYRLGVNEDAPSARVEIKASAGEDGLRVRIDDATKLRVFSNGGTAIGGNVIPPTEGLYVSGNVEMGNAADIILKNGSGTETIRLNADVSGDGRIITNELEITGGSDISEKFSICGSGVIEPGMVVSISPDVPGQMMITTTSYDTKVAGVISGANNIQTGLILRQHGTIADGQYPIAMTGRVYVKAEALKHSIHAGDLLTSSNVPGHVMKAKRQPRMAGTILGKAMTSLESGKGEVMMLINLQ